MKKQLIILILMAIMLPLGATFPAAAMDTSYGAVGAAKLPDNELNLANMLTFAIQDEYLARGEYQKVLEKFGKRSPFSNIIKAEVRHIGFLRPLFKKYGVTMPPDRGLELATVPGTFAEALQVGVNAEVQNIAIYERFLKKELPDDVRSVFSRLLAGSQNHLASFQGGRGRSK